MTPLDHQLDRLLRSAASAPATAVPPLTFTQEARILAGWRRAVRDGVDPGWLLALWRRGAVVACTAAAVALAASWLARGPVPEADPLLATDQNLIAAVNTAWLP